LIFAQRWKKEIGIGSLTALMLPYSIWMLITGLALVIVWVVLGVPLGPNAPIAYALPG
jgi:aminobenzoyl-glutamate transport protein